MLNFDFSQNKYHLEKIKKWFFSKVVQFLKRKLFYFMTWKMHAFFQKGGGGRMQFLDPKSSFES